MAVTLDSPVINAAGAAPNAKGIQVTERALKKIRVAMAKTCQRFSSASIACKSSTSTSAPEGEFR